MKAITKLLLALLVMLAMPMTANAAVYVEDEAGNVEEYSDIPALSINGNVHLEYAVGVVTSDTGDGVIVYSTDGVDTEYNRIAYRPIPVTVGDVIQSIFVYRTDTEGNWDDGIIWRIDITK